MNSFLLRIMIVTLALVTPAAAQDESALIQKRNQVREMTRDGLATLYELQPGARRAIEHAAGYGVFSTFGIKIFFAGGSTGSGVVVNNRTHRDTFMKMIKVQAGLGFGASKDRLIFVFETQKALRDFVTQGWDFSGQANLSAMVADQGGTFTGAVSVSPGVYLYQLTETGLAASITLSGTKFFKDTDLH
ncbi:MAG: YSC84-related protein [Burkholderiales bacterium]